MTMMQLDGPGFSLPAVSTVCGFCRHWRPAEDRTCAAYPERDSIPLDIWLARHDHQDPYPGDHGIQFEPRDYPYARSLVRKQAEVNHDA